MLLTKKELKLIFSDNVSTAVQSVRDRHNLSFEDAMNMIHNEVFQIKPSWIKRFMEQAKLIASWSKDPSTKCGAVITDNKCRIVSEGFNGFPQRFPDKPYLLYNREMKYNLTVHSEINAIIFANKPLNDCIIFSWPMIPCCRCAAVICQTGISCVIYPELSADLKERWGKSEKLSKEIFDKCGINHIELPLSIFGE